MRYRIVPFRVSDWKVQTFVWWFPFWCDETRLIGYDWSEPVWFASSEEAEEWIRRDMEWRAANRDAKQLTRARRHAISPREYP